MSWTWAFRTSVLMISNHVNYPFSHFGNCLKSLRLSNRVRTFYVTTTTSLFAFSALFDSTFSRFSFQALLGTIRCLRLLSCFSTLKS